MKFIQDDTHFSKYYDEILVLLGTGLRISEFVGLTRENVDFKERMIKVDHQLIKKRSGEYYIEETKTSNGVNMFLCQSKSI